MNASTLPVPPGFPGTAVDAYWIMWVSTYTYVASTALVLFDAFLTLEQESRLVWNGRWGLPSVTYMLNRYGTVLLLGLNLVSALDYDLDMPSCYAWNLFSIWTIPVVMLLVEATLAMRVVALYGNNLKVKLGVWTWYIVAAVGMLAVNGLSTQNTYPVPSPAPPLLGCEMGGSFSTYWALWVPNLVFEITVVIMTLGRAVHHRHVLSSAPLLYVLIRDGFFYFLVVLVLMLINLVICLTLNELYIGWTPEITVSLASIMAARLFLNLREAASNKEGATWSDSGILELHPMTKGTASNLTQSTNELWAAAQKEIAAKGNS